MLFPVMLIFFLTLWHRRIIMHCNAENAGDYSCQPITWNIMGRPFTSQFFAEYTGHVIMVPNDYTCGVFLW